MSIHTESGHTINALPHYGGLKVIIECSESVCETVEFSLNTSQWDALVNQGNVALDEGGQ